jgi:hypothetical protein
VQVAQNAPTAADTSNTNSPTNPTNFQAREETETPENHAGALLPALKLTITAQNGNTEKENEESASSDPSRQHDPGPRTQTQTLHPPITTAEDPGMMLDLNSFTSSPREITNSHPLPLISPTNSQQQPVVEFALPTQTIRQRRGTRGNTLFFAIKAKLRPTYAILQRRT